MVPTLFFLLFFKYPAVSGYRYHLPGDKFAAVFQGCHRRVFDTAAAGHLHPYNSQAPDVILTDDFRQFFTVIHTVQLGAATRVTLPRIKS